MPDRDDITEQYAGPELAEVRAEKRANRPTPNRLAKLEVKADKVDQMAVLLADVLAANKWRRDIITKVVGAVIALATGYLLGRHG